MKIRFFEGRPELRLTYKLTNSLAWPGKYAIYIRIQHLRKKWFGAKWEDVQERYLILMGETEYANGENLIYIGAFNLEAEIVKFWKIYFDREQRAREYASKIIPIIDKL